MKSLNEFLINKPIVKISSEFNVYERKAWGNMFVKVNNEEELNELININKIFSKKDIDYAKKVLSDYYEIGAYVRPAKDSYNNIRLMIYYLIEDDEKDNMIYITSIKSNEFTTDFWLKNKWKIRM